MDPVTLTLLVLSAGASIGGAISQGKAERKQARTNQQRAEVAGTWNDQKLEWDKQQMDWQQQQIDWLNAQLADQQEDLGRQAERDDATLLTQSAAMGIMGPMVDQARGYTAGEYNRAISRLQEQIGRNETQKSWIDTQKGWVDTQGQWADIQQQWGVDDYQSLIDQSYVNQAFNIGTTLLGTGANIYGWGANENLWGSGMPDNAGNVIQPYFKQPKTTRGSLWSWNKGFAT
jgi:hypothetical protein